MKTYLIEYGAHNDKATFKADDHHHAVEQFVDWEPIQGAEASREAITSVSLVLEIENWNDAANVYAVGEDQSWFHSSDLSLVTLPEDLTDADEIEDFIMNNRGHA